MNFSATFNVFRLLTNPSLCLPSHQVSQFHDLKFPLTIFNLNIKGIVLDKDNCFALPHDDKIYPLYNSTFDQMKKTYPKENLLVVSNSAGSSDDKNYQQLKHLEKNIGINILKHSIKKPGCYKEILNYFEKKNIKSNQIVVVGDRLFTDILMANLMGCKSIWIIDGPLKSNSLICRFERFLHGKLINWGFKSPN